MISIHSYILLEPTNCQRNNAHWKRTRQVDERRLWVFTCDSRMLRAS